MDDTSLPAARSEPHAHGRHTPAHATTAHALFAAGRAELARLRVMRGAHHRTARRLRRAIGLLAVGAGLVGAPLDAAAATPVFHSPLSPLGDDTTFAAAPGFADLDGDGDFDAFVGSDNGRTLFFENTGNAGTAAFAPSTSNPFGLADVGSYAIPRFADIDGDGDLDAFVGNSTGDTYFFENTGGPSAPAFAGPTPNPFGLTAVDDDAVPALVDIDGDGDLDVFIGDSFEPTLFFENTGTISAPAFAPSVQDPFDLGGFEWSPEFADLDGDGDFDALYGDRSGNLRFFENTGTPSNPVFASSTTNPFGLTSVDDDATPALVDIDADGDLDVFIGDDNGDVIFIENAGTTTTPSFSLTYPNPLGITNRSVGATPTFADLDGDGDLDALVGARSGPLEFFENTGSEGAPAFAPATDNPFGLSDPGIGDAPDFVDIDADGDFDVFLGDTEGRTDFLENTGTATTPAFASPTLHAFGLADVGSESAPVFADIDGDGDFDAFFGRGGGQTRFFENTGDASMPAFGPFTNNPFGLSDVGNNSKPHFADIDHDGDLDAFVGNFVGAIRFFENTGDATAPAFAAPTSNPFGLEDVGLFSAPVFVDIDADGDLDGLIGTLGGHTIFFENIAWTGCPDLPDPTCLDGFGAGSLLVKETKVGREQVVAVLSKGPAVAQPDLGDPLGLDGPGWGLCLYDDEGELARELVVDRAGDTCGTKPCWKSLGGAPPTGKGFSYKDKDAAASGVQSLLLKGGDEGRSVVKLKASNNAKKGQTSLPVGTADALASSAVVEMHVVNEEGACFGSTLDQIFRFPGFLKAKRR